MTLSEVLSRTVSSRPEHLGLVYGVHRLTFAELDRAVRSCMKELILRCGGSRVRPAGVRLGRTPEYVIAYLALARLGWPVLPFDDESPDGEIADEIRSRKVGVLLTGRAAGALGACPEIAVERTDPSGGEVPWTRGEDATAAVEDGDVRPDDPLVLLRTSGSTSRPKRVVLSHRNVLASARAHRSSLEQGEEVSLAALTLSFGYCNTTQLVSQIDAGGTLVLLAGAFLPSTFARAVRANGVTTTTLVPSMLTLLADWPSLDPDELATLRTIVFGGAPIAPEVLDTLHRRLPHVELAQTYGQTEAGPRITTLRGLDARRKAGSVGRAVPGMRIAVRSETGHDLPPGELGQVVVKGPGVTAGYHDDPEGTAAVLRDGWLHTGDLGRLDDEGFLWIRGRLRNLIITSGKNVAAEEVEACLRQVPGVTDAAVYGAADRLRGEAIRALLVTEAGDRPPVHDIRAFVAARLPAYKVPRRFGFVTEIPKTKNGKISRSELPDHDEKGAAEA